MGVVGGRPRRQQRLHQRIARVDGNRAVDCRHPVEIRRRRRRWRRDRGNGGMGGRSQRGQQLLRFVLRQPPRRIAAAVGQERGGLGVGVDGHGQRQQPGFVAGSQPAERGGHDLADVQPPWIEDVGQGGGGVVRLPRGCAQRDRGVHQRVAAADDQACGGVVESGQSRPRGVVLGHRQMYFRRRRGGVGRRDRLRRRHGRARAGGQRGQFDTAVGRSPDRRIGAVVLQQGGDFDVAIDHRQRQQPAAVVAVHGEHGRRPGGAN